MIEINKDGIIDDYIEVPCPTCQGKKSIPDAKYFGVPMGYCGANGERSPHIPCRTCNATGWIKKKNN